jgi:hypothetical protein
VAIVQDPVTPNTVYAATETGVFKSTDAGAHWNITGAVRTATAPMFTYAIAIDPTNPNIIYAGTNNGIYKSTDGGNLYDVKNNGFFGASAVALAVDPVTRPRFTSALCSACSSRPMAGYLDGNQ